MLADDFMVKKLKNKELHGLLCNKLSKEWIKRLTELLFN